MPNIKLSTRREILFMFLVLPGFIGLAVFFLVPFVTSLYMAMIDNPIGRNFVGFSHFTATFENAAFSLAMGNTIHFMAMSVPASMAIALAVASMLHHVGGFGKNVLGIFFLLPLAVPSGSVVHFWNSMFGMNGMINGMFFRDAPIAWFNTDFSIYIVLLIFIWKSVGFNIVLYLAGLNLIPKEYYECAQIEGAGRVRQFFKITLIYLAPTSFMVFLMSIVQSFRAFREIFLLTGAHPHNSIYMLQHYMNNQFAALNYQRLSAASYILTLGIAAIVLIMFYVQRRVMSYE